MQSTLGDMLKQYSESWYSESLYRSAIPVTLDIALTNHLKAPDTLFKGAG